MTKTKITRISILFLCMLLLTGFNMPLKAASQKAEAAEKPSINDDSYIGIGSIETDEFFYGKSDKYTLKVYNANKKASYSFSSSNKQIVTVKSGKAIAYLTGIKAGKATITCNQKLNGKTTKVGTCKVQVLNSGFYKGTECELPIGDTIDNKISIFRRNVNAVYTYETGSKDLIVKDYIKKDKSSKDIYTFNQKYTAKKAGTYTVTVKETYNKKTRTLGKVKCHVKKAQVNSEYTLDLDSSMYAMDLVSFARSDVAYAFNDVDGTIVKGSLEDGFVKLKGVKEGTVDVEVYEDAKSDDDMGTLIGTCKVTVKKVELEEVVIDIDDTTVYKDGDTTEFYAYKEPENAPGTIKVTSSNPAVATVSELDEEGRGEITPVSAGKTTITATCGDKKATIEITVEDDSDDSYDDSDDSYDDSDISYDESEE